MQAIESDTFKNNPHLFSLLEAFRDCHPVTSIPAGLIANNTEIGTLEGMFNTCGITAIPAGFFDNLQKAYDFSLMFYQCEGLVSVPNGLFDVAIQNAKNAFIEINFSGTFSKCNKLTKNINDLFALSEYTNIAAVGHHPNGSYLGLFEKYNGYDMQVTGDALAFYNKLSGSTLTWDGKDTGNSNRCFYGCPQLTNLNNALLEKWQ
jgi:hypothetical protein